MRAVKYVYVGLTVLVVTVNVFVNKSSRKVTTHEYIDNYGTNAALYLYFQYCF